MSFKLNNNTSTIELKNRRGWMTMAFVMAGALALPGTAFAQFTDASQTVCNFFGNTNSILNLVSVVVVTIAVVFAGYQIAFAHKRIADVAPILIGGVLIGAAGQVAKMLIPQGGTCTAKGATGFVMHLLQHYA